MNLYILQILLMNLFYLVTLYKETRKKKKQEREREREREIERERERDNERRENRAIRERYIDDYYNEMEREREREIDDTIENNFNEIRERFIDDTIKNYYNEIRERETSIKNGSELKDSDCLSECVICIEDYKSDDIIREINHCKHSYHVKCIDEWFEGNNSCPECRYVIS
jgi:hypothetical protein